MSSDQAEYYRVRALEEFLYAANTTGSVSKFHLELAEKYESLVWDAECQAPLQRDRDGEWLNQLN